MSTEARYEQRWVLNRLGYYYLNRLGWLYQGESRYPLPVWDELQKRLTGAAGK